MSRASSVCTATKLLVKPSILRETLTSERSIAARSVSVVIGPHPVDFGGEVVRVVEEVDHAFPNGGIESVGADCNLDAIAPPLLGWEIVTVVTQGAPVAGSQAITWRLAVDVHTIAALAAEDESAPQQILFWVR